MERLVIFCLLSQLQTNQCIAEPQFKLALHAQAKPTDDLIVGSILTTSGLASAFTSITQITTPPPTFYPFNYENLNDQHASCFDLVIIEGFFQMITPFIHEVRRNCPDSVVIFWSLDPDFVSKKTLVSFDFDGIMTNSHELLEYVLQFVDGSAAEYLPLAADTNLFKMKKNEEEEEEEEEMEKEEAASAEAEAEAEEKRDIVFVGSGGAILANSKVHLAPILRAVAKCVEEFFPKLRLVVYGKAWDNIPEFKPYYRGVLKDGLLAEVYQNAFAVIGVTMDGQREAGMINNRVYEVLATGTPFISDHFPGELGDRRERSVLGPK